MKDIFYFQLTPENPIIKNHTVYGQTLLPGMAYIDIIYQIVQSRLSLDYSKYSLNKLSIYQPLIVGDHPVELKLIFERKQNFWKIRAESTENGNNKLYMTAELQKTQFKLTGQVLKKSLRQKGIKKTAMEAVYSKARELGLVHQNMIKSRGKIYTGEKNCWIDIETDGDDFLMHPALIDGAGMASMAFVRELNLNLDKKDLFLPIAVDSFYSKKSVTNHCLAVVHSESVRQMNDIIAWDIEFYSEEGEHIALLKGLTAKRIRSIEQIQDVSLTKNSDSEVNPGNSDQDNVPGSSLELPEILMGIFTKYVRKNREQINSSKGFFELGLESNQLLGLVADIEKRLNLSLSPSLLFEYSNFPELLGYLEEKIKKEGLQIENHLLVPEAAILPMANFDFHETDSLLQDHLVYDKPALMGIMHPCLALESYMKNVPEAEYPVEIKNIRFAGGPIGLNPNETAHVKIYFNEGEKKAGFKAAYYTSIPEQETDVCTGDFIGPSFEESEIINLEQVIQKSKKMDQAVIEDSYHKIKNFKLGPLYKTLDTVYELDSFTLIGKVNLKQEGYTIFDPLLLNSCYMLNNFNHLKLDIEQYSDSVFVPLAIEKLILYRAVPEQVFIIKKIRRNKEDFLAFDAIVVNDSGEIIAKLINVAVKLVRSQNQLTNLMQVKSQTQPSTFRRMDIAVIGLSGRYPGADNMSEFWDVLKNGKNCITEIPADRWNWKNYFDAEKGKAGKIYTKWGGFIGGVDEFDSLFFNISPREAEYMDPQERLFLECVYHTLEDAGYTRFNLYENKAGEKANKNKVGVFVGVMNEEYQLYAAQEQMNGRMIALPGNSSAVANRVSYFFNFQGPSMSVDTMCSSSLTAVHLACNSIERGECFAAVVGGVNVSIHLNKYLLLSQGNFASSNGLCESFGKGGDGYVPSEGVGAVLLKPLSDAIASGDHIYGVIKGSMINAGGKTSGYTVPNPAAQGDLIGEALDSAGVHPRSISYIEAHGTGTVLGDPIEISGLTRAFQKQTQDKQFCSVGSVKSNIGHCESAAGIAAITKVLLQLKYKQLVPSIHSQEVNPNINFSETPFFIQQNLADWKSEGIRTAGISSMGAGGSNAHIIIQEFNDTMGVDRRPLIQEDQAYAILLSAKDRQGLLQKVNDMIQYVKNDEIKDQDLPSLSFTLQFGREEMEERLAFSVHTVKELDEKLSTYGKEEQGLNKIFYGHVQKNMDFQLFTVDDDLHKVVGNWANQGKLDQILELWIKGLDFDWNKLYSETKPGRISLPLYPFHKTRFWIPGSQAVEVQQTEQPEKIVLVKEWIEKELKSVPVFFEGLIVVLAAKPQLKQALRLAASFSEFQTLVIVHGSGKGKGWIGGDFYSRSSGDSLYEDFKKVKGAVRVSGLIDITALDADYESSFSTEAGKLRFLQNLIEYNRNDGFKLIQVTQNLIQFQTRSPSLQGARSAGLYRMLGSEYSQIESVSMDTDISAHSGRNLPVIIKNELFHRGKNNITEVCYRKNLRYEPVFATVLANEDIKNRQKFTDKDVILITGGSRGIGAAIAGHLVSLGLKKIVLLGKDELPNKKDWKEVIESETVSADVKQKLELFQGYGDQGVQVLYYNTPLTDKKLLRRMLQDIHKKAGKITGVYHCAGVMNTNPAFYKKTMEEIESVCGPKIKGLAGLYQTLEKEPLKFFHLFSSVTAVIPSLSAGQSDYAMANSFLDYFAAFHWGQNKKNIRSFQWPAWSETGMGTKFHSFQSQAFINSGFLSLPTKDGLELLDLVQNINCPVSLPAMINPGVFSTEGLLSVRNEKAKQGISCKKTIPVVEQKRVKPSSVSNKTVDQWVKGIVQAELKLQDEQMDAEKPFEDYGVDSIIIAQMTQVFQKNFKTPLPPTLFIECKTLKELTDYFIVNHQEDIQNLLKVNVDYESGREEYLTEEPGETEVQNSYNAEEEIAVVGIACNFPGAKSKDAYWDLLTAGNSVIKPVPESRWKPGNGRLDYGGWIDNIDEFDAGFFKIKDNDAEVMDPQARIILEESLKAVYDAGYDHKILSGQKIGVFIGGRAQTQMQSIEDLLQASNPILGTGQNYLASNISRFFNFTGPSIVLDTACSSGLTALAMASDYLKNSRIKMALIGAVNLLLNPMAHEVFAMRNILSKTGEFHIFDQRAGGEVLGEGAGMVMLKRLSDAVKDGNQIYGVVKAAAINNDGKTLGPGSPNLNAQKAVIQEALKAGHVNIEDVGYIEVNGGGSTIIDAVEIKALSEIYQLKNTALKPCSVGSIKPNIGHLLLTSGMAGFIRCILSVHNKKLPPFLSAVQPVDYYNFKDSRVLFNRETIDWKTEENRKRIAVQNSFPDGGTNCHVIMEEFIPDETYRQMLFPKELPELRKKRFDLFSRNSEEGFTMEANNSSNPDAGFNFNDFKNQYEIKLNQDKKSEISVENAWGKFDE